MIIKMKYYLVTLFNLFTSTARIVDKQVFDIERYFADFIQFFKMQDNDEPLTHSQRTIFVPGSIIRC